jgi:hypothetical protein
MSAMASDLSEISCRNVDTSFQEVSLDCCRMYSLRWVGFDEGKRCLDDYLPMRWYRDDDKKMAVVAGDWKK